MWTTNWSRTLSPRVERLGGKIRQLPPISEGARLTDDSSGSIHAERHGTRSVELDSDSIWGIADDVLRDLYVRGKYRDVILPMTVLRRLDAVLEPDKQAVLDMKASLDKSTACG